MLAVLLAKDLRRAWRNPIAFAIHLAVPILITALIGLAFGGSNENTRLGRIKLAIVDEDNSPLSKFLRGAINQGEGGRYLEPVFLSRADALRQIGDNQLSGVIVLPKGFTLDYVTARRPVMIELIKNPAQAFYPAIIEELLQAVATALNAVQRNFRPELAEWQALFDRTNQPSAREVSDLVAKTGGRLEAVRDYLFPPLIQFKTAPDPTDAGSNAASGPAGKSGTGPVAGVFGYILPGMAALFLLFIADNAIRDLYREERFRTFQRFRTLRHGLLGFVGAKVVFAMVILLLSCLILFGGGSVIFQFHWSKPAALALLSASYALFAAGFMALIASLAGSERRADTLNTIIAMSMGLAGGCMFPRNQLPAFIGNNLTPLMPTYWFTDAVRVLQMGATGQAWVSAALLLAVVGFILVALAAWMFKWRMQREGHS
jgi:ABC-type multidrug transport system permease subunit